MLLQKYAVADCLWLFAGSLVAQVTAVSEKVDSMNSRLQHKADKDGLQEAKQQLNSVRQQGQQCSQALADLKGTFRQQGQEQATALNRLEALITTCAHGRASKQHLIKYILLPGGLSKQN